VDACKAERSSRVRVMRVPRLLCATAALACTSVLWAAACGSRTEPTARDRRLWTPLPVRSADAGDYCLSQTDCASTDRCNPVSCVDNRCVTEPVLCDDGNLCTDDSCDPENGQCRFVPLTRDRDGDGFAPPRRGFLPTDAEACGTDCDDTSAQAFPGNAEVCDGLDNDCDGVVDNDARFVANPMRLIHLSNGAKQASVGGIAYSDVGYGAVFSQMAQSASNMQNTFANLLPNRLEAPTPVPIALVPNDTFAGPIVWTGQVFASVWEDRRNGDYEIYFNRLSSDGKKLDPDQRVTNSPRFSLRPSLSFDGNDEFRIAWDDERPPFDGPRIYGQRLSLQGEPIGENVLLGESPGDSRAPVLASGKRRLGLVFSLQNGTGNKVAFRSLAHDLTDPSPLITVSGPNAAAPSIVANEDTFIVAWHIKDGATYGPDIRGTVLSETGEVLVAERALTAPAAFARGHALLPFGDRVMVVWSEFEGSHYNLRARELSPLLEGLTEKASVTALDADATNPNLARGSNGEVGVLFSVLQPDAGAQVYFTSLSCTGGP
jgi:hypothetical protein